MNFPPEQQWKVGLTETETKMLIPREEELGGFKEEKDQKSRLRYGGYQ